MQIFLERNGLWSNDAKAYLYQTIDSLHQGKVTEEPKDMRKVSLYDINSKFNDRVCIDHLFIDKHVNLHFMDSTTRLSHGSIITSRLVHEAIDMFENIWVSQYGYPKAILALRFHYWVVLGVCY